MTNDPGNTLPTQGPNEALIAHLQSPEAILNPDPASFRAAGEVLRDYFTGKAANVPTQFDQSFVDAVDNVMSAVGGFYSRDERTYGSTLTGKIGDHPADTALEGALQAALAAQGAVEAKGGTFTGLGSSQETGQMLRELTFFKSTDVRNEVGAASTRPLRLRAADTLRDATRSVDSNPDAYAALAHAGMYASEAVVALADIAARHDADTGDVGKWNADTNKLEVVSGDIPLYKDYLSRHISGALVASQQQ